MLGCYLDHVPPDPKQAVALLCVLWVPLVHYLCNIKARVHVPVITMCCACSMLNTAIFSPVPSCTPGILLGISCSPASHIILLPPTCRHICKASKTKLRFMKIHTEGSCPSPLHSYLWLQTPQALPHQRASEPHRMSISTLSIAQKMQVMLLFGTIAWLHYV